MKEQEIKEVNEIADVLIDNKGKMLIEVAIALYNAGYRKQKEGEWVWTENGEADCEKYWVCSACKEHDFVKTKYCPNCGAKMKGADGEN